MRHQPGPSSIESWGSKALPTFCHPQGCPYYLCHKALVLVEPRLSHGGLPVKTPGQLLQLLLADELAPQGQLPLVLGLLQALPGLRGEKENLWGAWEVLQLGIPSLPEC